MDASEFRKFIDVVAEAARPDRAAELAALCGEMLGMGISRKTYVHTGDPDKVVKYEYRDLGQHAKKYAGMMQNREEFSVWRAVARHPAWTPWFVPCLEITPCCKYLVQRRVRPLRPADLPAEMPVLFGNIYDAADIRNWGVCDGHAAMLDYGWARGLDRRLAEYDPAETVPVRVVDNIMYGKSVMGDEPEHYIEFGDAPADA